VWLRSKDPLSPERVLLPGCGRGYDLVPWAELLGIERVDGLDIAPNAVMDARILIENYAGKTSVELGDFFDPKYPAGSYDWLWEHTCFCAIPPAMRDAYVASAARALRPGGYLLAVFFLNPWDAGEDQTQGPPFGVSREELSQRFLVNFTQEARWAPDDTYPERVGREEFWLLRRI
jgi:methyl halide transferase